MRRSTARNRTSNLFLPIYRCLLSALPLIRTRISSAERTVTRSTVCRTAFSFHSVIVGAAFSIVSSACFMRVQTWSASMLLSNLRDRPRHDRGRFSFAAASSGACCRCAAAWLFRRASVHHPSSAPQRGQGAQRRAQDQRCNRDPRAQVNFLSFCSGFGIEVRFFTWYNL